MYYPRYVSNNFLDLKKKKRLANCIAKKTLSEVIDSDLNKGIFLRRDIQLYPRKIQKKIKVCK